MTPQVAVSSEYLSTGVALVGFVVRMGEQMRFQVRALIETSIAHRTFVRRLLHVQNLVHGQRSRLAETLAALGTFEWLFLGVDVSGMKETEKEKKTTLSKKYRITMYQQQPVVVVAFFFL